MALRDKLRQVISASDAPKKIAVSFAVGVFIGMSPILGLHTVLGLLLAWLLRLNKFVTIVGVYITNPWTIVPIYTFATWAGARILGINCRIPLISWNDMTLISLMKDLKPFLLPFFFGTTVVGLVSALAGYFVVHYAVVRHRK